MMARLSFLPVLLLVTVVSALLSSCCICCSVLKTTKQNFRNNLLRNLITSSVVLLTASKAATAATVNLSPPRLGVNSVGSFELCRGTSCTSSQDDRPNYFLAPWEYDGSFENMKGKLVRFVLSLPNNKLIADDNRYVRFVFVDEKAGSTDDLEFYFPENDSIIQYRCGDTYKCLYTRTLIHTHALYYTGHVEEGMT